MWQEKYCSAFFVFTEILIFKFKVMSNLEKFNSTKLSTSEMKEVQGGNWLDEVVKAVTVVLEPIVTPIVKAVGGWSWKEIGEC